MKNAYSIKVALRTDKVLRNGDCPLILRVIIDSKQKKIDLKERINPKYWDSKNSKALGKGFKILNNKLDKAKSDLVTFCSLKESGGISVTFELIDSYLKGKDDNDFFQVYDDIVASKKLKEDTEYKYTLLRSRLKEFKTRIFTSDINYNFIVKFDTFLRNKSIGDGGLYNHHKCLKSIINEAMKLDKMEKSPYVLFKFKGVKQNEVFLEESEVLKIRDLRFTVEERKKYAVSRDMFLFSCYTGLRYSDCYSLRVADVDFGNGILKIEMVKTGEEITLPINSQTKGLLCRYIINKKKEEKIFPEITNQVLNRNLKKIAEMAEIDKRVTQHVGRHTFASNLINRKNVPIPIVSKLLGHTNISNTMIYTNSNLNVLRNTMKDFRYGIKP